MPKGRLWKMLADLYGLLFFLMLVYLSFYGRLFNDEFWYAATHPLRPGIDLPVGELFASAALVFIAVVILAQLIKRVDVRFVPELATQNLNLRPLFHPVFRYPFAALLVWNLPILASLEEFIFRDGLHMYPTATWWDVVWRSLVFGMFHGFAAWNWRGGIVQAVLGFWFSYQYLLPGADPLLRASYAHFLVDALFVVPAVLTVLLGAYRPQVTKEVRPCS
jgi:hypothetical protein